MCLRARAATVTLFFQLVVTAFVTAASLEINAQNALVTTIAGRAGTMACADGGGAEAGFNRPWGLATDGSRIFVADTENNTIRMVDPASRTVSTLAGLALVAGEVDGDLAHARLSRPVSLLYHEGSLYVGEAFTGRIRRIDSSKGTVSTVVKPAPGRTALDGQRMTDVLCSASAMVIVGNTLYATDPWCDCVRAIDLSTGTVTTFAGSPGKSGSIDGARAVARFTAPEGLATDGKSLYVSDSSDSTVRKIDIATGAVTTIAGSPGKRAWVDGKGTVVRFEAPWSLLLDGRTLYVGQSGGVRAIDLTTMAVTTLAGSPTAIFAADGLGREAHFINCTGIVRIENAFYVMDTALGTLRRIARDPPDVSPQEVRLTFHAKGGRALVAPFETRGVDITRTKPAFVKRAPPITSPWWGVIIAARGGLTPGEMEKCSYAFAVDETPGREPVLYFDTNRNGDLTDDPPAEWAHDPTRDFGLNEVWVGGVWIDLPWGHVERGFLSLYTTVAPGGSTAAKHASLWFQPDWYRSGSIVLGGITWQAALVDAGLNFDFRGRELYPFRSRATRRGPATGVFLALGIDQEADPVDRWATAFPIHDPFTVNGVSYRISSMDASGYRFTISTMAGTTGTQPPSSPLRSGDVMPAFTSRLVDGSSLDFPGSARAGALVVHFWDPTYNDASAAAMIGAVVKMDAAYRQRGLQSLVVCLATADTRQYGSRVFRDMQDLSITCPVTFDGTMYLGPLVRLFADVQPGRTILVDGQTGKIVDERVPAPDALQRGLETLLGKSP